MPYSNIRKVYNVTIYDWVVAGEIHEDTQYMDTIYYVVAEDDHGERWVHECTFTNDQDAAVRLAQMVDSWGLINLSHWGFHDFFSLSLEERLAQQYEDERMDEPEPSYVWINA